MGSPSSLWTAMYSPTAMASFMKLPATAPMLRPRLDPVEVMLLRVLLQDILLPMPPLDQPTNQPRGWKSAHRSPPIIEGQRPLVGVIVDAGVLLSAQRQDLIGVDAVVFRAGDGGGQVPRRRGQHGESVVRADGVCAASG